MNSLFTKHRWMQVMWGILLFVAGAITIIFASTNNGANVSLALSIAIALVLFAYGLTIIFNSFLELKDGFFKYEIIIGSFIIAAGIVFCLNIQLIKDIIVSMIAASFLVFGTVFLVRFILSISLKLKVWWKTLSIILAVLLITAGVLCIVFRAEVVDICFIILGVILTLIGLIEIFMSIKLAIEASKKGIGSKSKNKKDGFKPSKKEVIDVPVKVEDEKKVEEIETVSEEKK